MVHSIDFISWFDCKMLVIFHILTLPQSYHIAAPILDKMLLFYKYIGHVALVSCFIWKYFFIYRFLCFSPCLLLSSNKIAVYSELLAYVLACYFTCKFWCNISLLVQLFVKEGFYIVILHVIFSYPCQVPKSKESIGSTVI